MAYPVPPDSSPITNPAANQTMRNSPTTTMLLRLLRVIWWYIRVRFYEVVRRSLPRVWPTDLASHRPQIWAQTNPFPNADWSSAWCLK